MDVRQHKTGICIQNCMNFMSVHVSSKHLVEISNESIPYAANLYPLCLVGKMSMIFFLDIMVSRYPDDHLM